MDIYFQVKKDGIWVVFEGVNATISLKGLIQKSSPIVAKELKKWGEGVRAEHKTKEWDNARDA